MKMSEYFLIQKITEGIRKKAARDGTAEDDSRQVRQVSIYRWIFWTGALLGLIFGGVCWLFHQPEGGLVMFLLFELLAVPGLCAQYNCILTYDEEGFTWRNLLRISYRYSYEEVTGLYSSPLRVVVELSNHKQLDLDENWLNRQNFAQAIRKYRSQKPPKLTPPVLGMSASEISESYEKGTLSQAMLVKEGDRPRFIRFKCLHYGIFTLSGLFAAFAIFCGPAFEQIEMLMGLLLLGLPGTLCMVASLYLYFRYPQYFTVREKPSAEILSKKNKAIHKRSTISWVSLLCLPGGSMFFLAQLNGKNLFWPLWLAAGAAVIVFFGLLLLFRRVSWEYRNFRIGYVSFAIWQAIFCLSIFFILGGLFIS